MMRVGATVIIIFTIKQPSRNGGKMDLSYFLILIVVAIAVDLYVHWRIVDRQVKQLHAESKRFEAEWQSFLNELKEAVKAKAA